MAIGKTSSLLPFSHLQTGHPEICCIGFNTWQVTRMVAPARGATGHALCQVCNQEHWTLPHGTIHTIELIDCFFFKKCLMHTTSHSTLRCYANHFSGNLVAIGVCLYNNVPMGRVYMVIVICMQIVPFTSKWAINFHHTGTKTSLRWLHKDNWWWTPVDKEFYATNMVYLNGSIMYNK